MADKKRKDDTESESEREDEDEAEGSSAEEAEGSEAEGGDADDGDSKSDAAESDEEGASESDEGGAEDAGAQRVAAALGVGSDEGAKDEEPVAEKEPDAVQNRSLRRREAALERRRRKGKSGVASAKSVDADDPLPKDKNARAKELLKRRREQAAEPRAINLLPGEMVDDALARSSSAVSKWFRDNFGKIQWVILAGIAAAAGYGLYTSQVEKKAAAATDSLAAGVADERGRVMAEDKRADDEKDFDPAKVYKTAEERTEAALAAYRKTAADYPTTAAGLLARLGEAGMLLDKHDWAGAAGAYEAVRDSKLGDSDPDVKGRAIEGLGFAKEGKGDLDGAMAAFKELQGVDVSGYRELGMYQEARIHLAKGETDKAKDLLKQVHDKLATPTATEVQHSSRYLEPVVDDALRKIDPSLVPTKAPVLGGAKGSSMSPEDLERIKKMIHDASGKKPPGGDEH